VKFLNKVQLLTHPLYILFVPNWTKMLTFEHSLLIMNLQPVSSRL